MFLTKQRLANGRQNMIVIVVTHIKREVAVDALQRAWAVQTARPAGPNAALDGVLRQIFHDVPSAASSKLGLLVMTCLPQARNMLQPKIAGLHVDGTLSNVVLDIWVAPFVL